VSKRSRTARLTIAEAWEHFKNGTLTKPQLKAATGVTSFQAELAPAFVHLDPAAAVEYLALEKPASRRVLTLQKRLYPIVAEQQPATVRGMYYQATVHCGVAKTDEGYDLVQRQLLEMRRADTIPYEWIVDNTRIVRQRYTSGTVSAELQSLAASYHLDPWPELGLRVEIWCEKDALAGVLQPVTDARTVPLYICRGQSSETYAYNAAETIKSAGMPTHIYYFGDYDGAGLDICDSLDRKLREFVAGAVEIHFERVAVNKPHLKRYPTRAATKKRDRQLGLTEACELDAIPAPTLRAMAARCIDRHLKPPAAQQVLQDVAARAEDRRAQLQAIADAFNQQEEP